jgi:RNA polymerase sigma-70 factor (ECF subfamily)
MDTSKKSCELSKYALELVHHKARELVGKPGFAGQDAEDIEQDLIVDLLERLPKYDPAKAANNTFVARLVERKISRTVRDRERKRRDPGDTVASLNDEVVEADGSTVEFAETLCAEDQDRRFSRESLTTAEQADLEVDVAEALAGLPDELRRVAEALMTLNIAEAGRKLGIPRWKLHEVYLPQLRAAFEERGLGDYLQP